MFAVKSWIDSIFFYYKIENSPIDFFFQSLENIHHKAAAAAVAEYLVFISILYSVWIDDPPISNTIAHKTDCVFIVKREWMEIYFLMDPISYFITQLVFFYIFYIFRELFFILYSHCLLLYSQHSNYHCLLWKIATNCNLNRKYISKQQPSIFFFKFYSILTNHSTVSPFYLLKYKFNIIILFAAISSLERSSRDVA